MTHPLVPVFLYPLYLLIRLLIHAVRNIVWRFNGVSKRRQEITHNPYTEASAHVLDIAMRFKFDTLIQGNKLDDFVLVHNKFCEANYVLKDEVSLYTINDKECVFVECAPGQSAWDLTRFSFSREGQYNQAIRVVILPIAAAHCLAERIGSPVDKVIILGNISRCGSTLMCRMFQSTGHFCSYTEPGVLCDLVPYVGLDHEQKVVTRVRTAMILLCKPQRSGQTVEGHVVKVVSSATAVISLIYNVFPEFHYLFMYRNQRQVLKSLARLAPSRPFIRLQEILDTISRSLSTQFTTYNTVSSYNAHRADDGNSEDRHVSPYTKVMTISIQALAAYYKFVDEGMAIYAVRFDDVIQDPKLSMERIFKLCGIPRTLILKALRPLDSDAQEQSPLKVGSISKYKIPQMTDQDELAITQYCRYLRIPDALSRNILPNTVTFSGD